MFLYASWFSCFNCNLVHRECNLVSNLLAHIAVPGGPGEWIEDPPEDIIYALYLDDLS